MCCSRCILSNLSTLRLSATGITGCLGTSFYGSYLFIFIYYYLVMVQAQPWRALALIKCLGIIHGDDSPLLLSSAWLKYDEMCSMRATIDPTLPCYRKEMEL